MRWICGLVLLVSQLGCLGFFDEPQPSEERANNPPWIDLSTIEPQSNYVTIDKTNSPPGTSKTFIVRKVLDFDARDTLRGYWVLVTNKGVEKVDRTVLCGKEQDPPTEDFNPFALRDVNFECAVDFSRAQLEVDKDVILEMYVFDQQVEVDDLTLPGLSGLPSENFHFAAVKWILQVR